jgi:hypothetical protein
MTQLVFVSSQKLITKCYFYKNGMVKLIRIKRFNSDLVILLFTLS